MSTMKIPTDPRCPGENKPLVTSAMKAECIGEFAIERQVTCPSCYFDGEVPQDDCTVCGGNMTYTEKIDIPWDTMKDIYKLMATAAAREVGQ